MKQKRLMLFTILLIVISFVLTTLVSVYSLRKVIKGNNEELSKVLATKIYDSINNRLTEPIVVAQTMSSDYFLMEPMESDDFPSEDEEKGVVAYLQNLSGTMNYSSAFVISERSRKYYTQDGFNKIVSPETDSHDIWYSTFLDTGKKIDFDVDTDEAHGNQWTVFVNARIEDEGGNLLGVCGVSVVMTDLQEILKKFVEEYRVQINLINDEDAIMVNAGEIKIEKAVLDSTSLSEYEGISDYIYEDMKDGGYVIRKYMDNLDWLLEVKEVSGTNKGVYASLIYRNMIIFVVIMLILIGLVSSNIAYDKRRTEEYTRKIEQYAKEQEVLKAQAESASIAKGNFLANMSHEIRTPINAVLGFDEMILREAGDEAILQYAANIRTSGQTLLALINDILDFSKIESGKMDIVMAEYDTLSILSEPIDMITPRAEAKGLVIYKEIDDSIPSRLYGDDVRIRQVITNILTNAVKYTEKGSIRLKVYSRNSSDGNVVLSVHVCDTGIGIKEEDREKLFESFQRVDESRNRTIEGTGLGLSITTKCLELMGSRLEVDSTYGKGSDFHFDLMQKVVDSAPIGDFELAYKGRKNKVEAYKESFTAPKARVLVVDDTEMNLLVFKGLLKRTCMHIDTAGGGADSLRLVRENSYDIIFMDHLMPEMDGIETLGKMKEEMPERIAGVPVIALTANAVSGAKEEYMKNGFSDYLSKPLDGKLLEEICIKWLPREKVEHVIDIGSAPGKESIPGEESVIGAESIPNSESAPAAKTNTEPVGEASPAEILAAEELVDEALGLSYCADNKELYIEMIGAYISTSHDKKLEQALSEGNWNNYRIHVHGLKSTSLFLGAMQLSEFARQCEEALKKDGGQDFIREHHESLLKLYKETVSVLEKKQNLEVKP